MNNLVVFQPYHDDGDEPVTPRAQFLVDGGIANYVSNVDESSNEDRSSDDESSVDLSNSLGSTEKQVNFNYICFHTYPDFGPENKSLTAKYLTQELFNQLKDKKTSKGYTLSNAIQDGVVHQHLMCGTTAGDEECWEIFKELYYPMIYSLHGFDAYTQKHGTAQVVDLDPFQQLLKVNADQATLFHKHVLSTRIRAVRNIRGFSLPSGTTEKERACVEEILVQTFATFKGELAGTYYQLEELDNTTMQSWVDDGFLFQTPSDQNMITGAGAARSWPNNRGIFLNASKTALAWVNEEDHCRIISMEVGGNIQSVFARFCKISNELKHGIEGNGNALMWNETLGFLATCPTNLGTALRASFMVELIHFNQLLMEGNDRHDKELLHYVCARFDLQVRGSRGEHSPADGGGKFDLSNKQRMGQSEVQLVQKLIYGVAKVLHYEQLLADGKTGGDIRALLESESEEENHNSFSSKQ